MSIIKNIITVPKPDEYSKLFAGVPPEAAEPSSTVSLLSGKVSNGHTEIFAELQPGATGETFIRFSVEIPSVNRASFDIWQEQVSAIIGPDEEEKIAGITSNNFVSVQNPAHYSLAAFSYVTMGDLTSYDNLSNLPFGPPQSLPEEQLERSIKRLDSPMIHLEGILSATSEHPEVRAYIPATYFLFADNTLICFVSYSEPVVLVYGGEEMVTAPGILAVSL